jgi:hypothetical protein
VAGGQTGRGGRGRRKWKGEKDPGVALNRTCDVTSNREQSLVCVIQPNRQSCWRLELGWSAGPITHCHCQHGCHHQIITDAIVMPVFRELSHPLSCLQIITSYMVITIIWLFITSNLAVQAEARHCEHDFAIRVTQAHPYSHTTSSPFVTCRCPPNDRATMYLVIETGYGQAAGAR